MDMHHPGQQSALSPGPGSVHLVPTRAEHRRAILITLRASKAESSGGISKDGVVVRLRNHQAMTIIGGVFVHKGRRVVVCVQLNARPLARDDVTEYACLAGHERTLYLLRRGRSKMPNPG